MEQLAAAVHPTRIDGCAEKESVALATAVHAIRIHAKVVPSRPDKHGGGRSHTRKIKKLRTGMEEAEATLDQVK